MELWVTIVLAVLGASGFWTLILRLLDNKTAKTKMILGLGHDRIIWLCQKYIDRGWISSDEHEDLIKYLYTPYVGLKGNGTAKRLIDEVNRLPIKKMTYIEQAKSTTSPATPVKRGEKK